MHDQKTIDREIISFYNDIKVYVSKEMISMGKNTSFLYLNEEDMIKAGVLDYAHCIDVEEELFGLLSKGDYVMGGDKHNAS